MLEIQNPWWKGKEHIEEDEDFIRWKTSSVKWIPSILEKINLEPYSLHFVSGPRQVGKTTMLKLLINNLLSHRKEKSIFYFRCDELSDFKELDEVLREYLKIREAEGIRSSFIFLDEVTFPSEWYRAIKWHIDMGHFKNDVLILTGSLSMFVKGEVETFPGRRGKGRDFIMYPLSFREFLKLVNNKIFEKTEAFEDLNNAEEKCFKALPWLEELHKILEQYLQCGGFPLSVKSFLETGRISNEVFTTYLSWIKGDLAKLGRSESIAKRVIKAIIEKTPSALSFNAIAKEFEIKSHKTVFQYVDILEKLHLAKVLYFIDPDKNTEVFYKQRKIYLTDPFLYIIFSYWCRTEKPDESILIESVVGSHLARRFNIGYWKNSREVDIVVSDDELTGVEVKYKKKPELMKIKIGKMKKVITLTKDVFNRDPPAVPVSTFLASLNV